MDKITEFRSFIHHFGYTMKSVSNGKDLSAELNKLLASAKGSRKRGY